MDGLRGRALSKIPSAVLAAKLPDEIIVEGVNRRGLFLLKPLLLNEDSHAAFQFLHFHGHTLNLRPKVLNLSLIGDLPFH